MQTHRLGICLIVAILCLPAVRTRAEEPLQIAAVQHDGPVDFEKEILPILRRNCLACHSSTNSESDLILETPQSILKGGSEGPAVVAGKSAASLLFTTAAHIEESFMPPEDNDVGARNLSPQELGLLQLWIDQGAKGEVLGTAAAPQWQPLPDRVNPIYAVAIAPDGDYLAASRANQIFMYHVPAKMLLGRLTDPDMVNSGTYAIPGVAHFDLVQSLAFSPDGQWLASGGYRTVKLWKRQDPVRKAELPKAEAAVTATARSGDGRMLAIAEDNGKIKLIDLDTGQVTQTLAGHQGAVNGVSFSADASQLVSGGTDKTYRIWNTSQGKQVAQGMTVAPVTAVSFAAEDKQVVTAEEDHVIRTWAVDAGQDEAGDNDDPAGEAPQPLKEMPGHTAPITDLAVMPGGSTHIVSASQDATVRRWDVNSGTLIRQFSHGGPVTSIAIRPDGKRIASVSDNGTSKLWDAENGQQLVQLDGTTALKNKVDRATLRVAVAQRRVENAKKDVEQANKRHTEEQANAKKAAEIVTSSEEDLKKKTEAAKKPEEEMLAAEMMLKAEEAKLATAEAAQKQADNDSKAADEVLKKAQENLKAKTTAAQKLITERTAAERAVEAAKRSLMRTAELVKIAAAAIPGYEAEQKQEEETLQQLQTMQQNLQTELTDAAAQQPPVRVVAFSPDGSLLVVAGDDGQVRTFSGETGQWIAAIANGVPVIGLEFGAVEGGLVAVGNDMTLSVWDAQPTWQLARTIGAHDKPEQLIDRVTSLDFSPDSQMLASGGGEPSRSGELKIWNVADGSLIRQIEDPHSDTVLGLEFSPDGRHIASCAADRFMKVFEISTGKFAKTFEGHTSSVLGVSWRADGRMLATCGADKAVKIWNFETGELSKTVQGFNKEVTSIEFMGSGDNWMCSSGDPQISTKNIAGGNVRNYGGPTGFMYSVRTSADGKVIAAGGQDSVVRVWNDSGQTVINFDPQNQ